jgi:general secretion pathway protein B
MSYILDALKKAESERQLGSVPSVYGQPLPIAKSDEPISLWRRPWSWIAAGFLVAAGIAWTWTLTSQKEAPHAMPAVAQQEISQPPVPTAVAQAPLVEREATQAISTPAMEKETIDNARTVKNVPTPVRDEKPATLKKPVVIAAKTPPEKSGTKLEPAQRSATQDKAPNAATTPPQTVDTEVALLRDLPEHIRSGLPSISVGGYIYSPNPAARSMLLNNRLVREGDQLASGLTLERMMPKEAVLNYQGQRFRLPY